MRKSESFQHSLRLLFLTLAVAIVGFGQEPQQIVPAYPTGALAVFPKSVDWQREGVRKILIRSDRLDDRRVWAVEPQNILIPNLKTIVDGDKALAMESGVGFAVPQLAKGIYIAWYETSRRDRDQSMKLLIVPELLADEAIKRSTPGEDVEIRVRISSSMVHQNNSPASEIVRAAVKITADDPTVANLVTGQPSMVSTDPAGHAAWKVHISKPGVARFVATAEGFEPVTVDVVGMPATARTYREAELLAAQTRAAELSAAAENLAVKASELARGADELQKRVETQM